MSTDKLKKFDIRPDIIQKDFMENKFLYFESSNLENEKTNICKI